MKCGEPECDEDSRTKGLCAMHYTRLWRHGSTSAHNGHKVRDIALDGLIKFKSTVLGKSIRQIAREMDVSRWSVTKAIKG